MPTLYYEIRYPNSNQRVTGIQRCTQKILEALYNFLPAHWTIKKVLGLNQFEGFIYADDFIEKKNIQHIKPVEGDIFLSTLLNLNMSDKLISAIKTYKDNNVNVNFISYDILPIIRPDFFEGVIDHVRSNNKAANFSNSIALNEQDNFTEIFSLWLRFVVSNSNNIHCISSVTKNNLKEWILKNHLEISQTSRLHTIPMAAERIKSGNPEPYIATLFKKDAIKFLMVGTIERRKGHEFILKCFTKLWEKGANISLMWAGTEGWPDNKLTNTFKNHPLLGTSFFYFDYVSDSDLSFLYESSDALISASEDEGFGLPNIEASRYNLSIIARDIPIFREVCGDHAFFFPDTNDEDLFITYLEKWLLLYASGNAPRSELNNTKTWGDVAQAILDNIDISRIN
jgi:glycosyltransferase involved in cell wall biosynthesis